MNAFGLAFDHFGLATCKPEQAVAFLKGLGYHIGEKTYDPQQRVNLILCPSFLGRNRRSQSLVTERRLFTISAAPCRIYLAPSRA